MLSISRQRNKGLRDPVPNERSIPKLQRRPSHPFSISTIGKTPANGNNIPHNPHLVPCVPRPMLLVSILNHCTCTHPPTYIHTHTHAYTYITRTHRGCTRGCFLEMSLASATFRYTRRFHVHTELLTGGASRCVHTRERYRACCCSQPLLFVYISPLPFYFALRPRPSTHSSARRPGIFDIDGFLSLSLARARQREMLVFV